MSYDFPINIWYASRSLWLQLHISRAYWILAPSLPSLVDSLRLSVKSEITGFQLHSLYPSANSDSNKLCRPSSLVELRDFRLSSNRDCTKVTSWLLYHFPEIKASIFWLYVSKHYSAWTLVLTLICQSNCISKSEDRRLLNSRVFWIRSLDRAGINPIFQNLKKLFKS